MIFLFIAVALALAFYSIYPSIAARATSKIENERFELEEEKNLLFEQIKQLKKDIENGEIDPIEGQKLLLKYEIKAAKLLEQLKDLPEVKKQSINRPVFLRTISIFILIVISGLLAWQFIIPPLQELALPSEEAKILRANRQLSTLKIDANSSIATLLQFGQVAWEAQQYEQAARAYTIILRRNPAEPTAIRRYGILLFFDGDNENALRLLNAAIKLDPNEPESYLNKGNLLFSIDDPAGAIEAWQNYRRVGGKSERIEDLITSARNRLQEKDLGAKLFAANCAGCHGSKGQGVIGPKLIADDKAKNLELIKKQIINGKGQMPAFTKFNEKELQSLAEFVKKLAEGR